jgi:hypothetical protein
VSDNLPNDFEGIVPGTSWTVISGTATTEQSQGFNAAVNSAQIAAATAAAAAVSASAAAAQAQAIVDSLSGISPTTFPDATTTTGGKIVLAGDLSGIASSPQVTALHGGDSTKVLMGNLVWTVLSTVAATPAQITTLTNSLNALSAQVALIPDVSTVNAQISALSARVSVIEASYNSLVAAGFPSNVSYFVRQNADGSWPQRPVTENLVMWIGISFPPTGGTTTSSTGFVEGKDLQILYPVV